MPTPPPISYTEGDWFAVPLRDGGYGLGVVARGGPKSRGGLGYFFGPRRLAVPPASVMRHLAPSDAVLVAWFGDLSLIRGEWPLIGSDLPFSREQWPVPRFAEKDPVNPDKGWLVEYDRDADGAAPPWRRTYVDTQLLLGLPDGATLGAGAVELRLTRILAGEG